MMTEMEFKAGMIALGASKEEIDEDIKAQRFIPLEDAYAFYAEHCAPKKNDIRREYRINADGNWVDD